MHYVGQMTIPNDLNGFKEQIIGVFEKNIGNDITNKALKSYLIESNLGEPPIISGFTQWQSIGGSWYSCNSQSGYFILNVGNGRIWTLHTLMPVKLADKIVDLWLRNTGLDRCWFTGDYLSNYGKKNGWKEKGVGIRYRNATTSPSDGVHFSLKTWYDEGLDKDIRTIIETARDRFVTTSVRWRTEGTEGNTINTEWYNDGKITTYYSDDVDKLISVIESIGDQYTKSLRQFEEYRNQKRSAFEFQFKCRVSLDEYSESLRSGKSGLKLWMRETERDADMRRFSGIDLHTGDRILLDMADSYAYMTIPGKGCVNAAPRFLAVNGENALGKIKVFYEGAEILE